MEERVKGPVYIKIQSAVKLNEADVLSIAVRCLVYSVNEKIALARVLLNYSAASLVRTTRD